MKQEIYPELEVFLTAPVEEVARVAPQTLIFAAGGTRRAAALAGIPLAEMADWTLPHMLANCELNFRLGVHHLIMPVARPQMFQETGYYREQLIAWLEQGLAGPENCAFYQQAGWRVRIVVAGKKIPELAQAMAMVDEATQMNNGRYLWFVITTDYDELWQWQIEAFQQGARTRQEAIKILYGENIPPVDLLLSYGKPLFCQDVMPPMLYDETQCYWLQKPGYEISERTLRTVFYDYAYTRQTWRQDKTGRAEQALANREAWEQAPVLGLGFRLGPFWYPQPFSVPGDTAVSPDHP